MAKVTTTELAERGKKIAQEAGRSPLLRAYARYRAQHGSRLAAAMTYSAFLSLFPLLAVAAAVTAATLGDSGIDTLRDQIDRNLPGLADKLPLDAIVQNATTIGVVGALLLVWSGLSWVNMTRGGLRAIWALDDQRIPFVRGKVGDLLSLIGLGLTAALSVAASAAASELATRLMRAVGMADRAGTRVLLAVFATLVGLAASTAMFAYLLAGIPRLRIPRRVLLRTALFGAVLFEVAKNLLAAYVGQVASKNLYGAFGVPIAVLIWFNLTFQLLLYMSAWTATRTEDHIAAHVAAPAADAADTDEATAPAPAAGETGTDEPGKPDKAGRRAKQRAG